MSLKRSLRLHFRWQLRKAVLDAHDWLAAIPLISAAVASPQFECKRNFDAPELADVVDWHAEEQLLGGLNADSWHHINQGVSQRRSGPGIVIRIGLGFLSRWLSDAS